MSFEHLDTVLGFAVIMLLLSLLVTVLVQSIIAVSGLRGANLRWGVERLLEQVDPRLHSHAGMIAEKVLQHPTIALIGKRKAAAIRPEEVVRVLDDLASGDPQLKSVLDPVLAGTAPGLDAQQAAAIAARLGALFPENAAAVKQAVHEALVPPREVVVKINAWFETVVGRTTDRFILHTRWLTAGVAFALALGMHIDALALLRRMSRDGELRARVLATADGALRSAEGVVSLSADRQALASAALTATSNDARAGRDRAALASIPAGLITRGQGESWLRERLGGSSQGAATLAAYHEHFDSATKVWIGALRDSTRTIQNLLQQASFDLVPNPYPGFFHYSGPVEFVGTVISALLLTLGAPFWFNLLRQMANLRPAIAERVAKEAAPPG